MAKICYRAASYEVAKVNDDQRTIPVAFSSETPVRAYGLRGEPDSDEYNEEFSEILSHAAEDVDMTRAMRGLPLMLSHNDHDAKEQVGIVEGITVDADKTMRGVARFSKSPLAEQIYQDVKAGIRNDVSVGYERTGIVEEIPPTETEARKVRFRWLPISVSVVPVPADTRVGFGRQQQIQKPQTQTTKISMADNNDIITGERNRVAEITKTADQCAKDFPAGAENFRNMASEAIAKGEAAGEFSKRCLTAAGAIKSANQITMDDIGVSQRDQKAYSLTRALANVLNSKNPSDPGGLEGDISKEIQKRSGLTPGGFFMPFDVRSNHGRRDLTIANQGSNMVQTTIVTPIIELLRNKMVTSRLGVQTLSGLQGNIAIPRQAGAATAYATTETAALTLSTQALDQVSLSPKRIGATNKYGKQLILQSSVDVENFVRDDLMKVLAIKHDQQILEGAGGGTELTGIKSTVGIGTVTFGAAATLAKMIEFETSLAAYNADAGNMAYVTSPQVRGTLKGAPKIGSTFPIFIWEEGNWNDGTNDGEVNGYRAAATNQISENKVVFGNWNDAVVALWGGFDVVVDPYTLATSAEVQITINTWLDLALRHVKSFAWSTDAGNQ